MADHSRLELDDSSISINFSRRKIDLKPKYLLILLSVLAVLLLFSVIVNIHHFNNQCPDTSTQAQNTDSSTTGHHNSSQLYVFGGKNDLGYNNTIQVLRVATHYNSSSNKWDFTTKMPLGLYSSCGAVIGTKIYTFGGWSYADTHGVSKAEVYDCETGTYSSYRGLPFEIYDCGAAALGGFVYVAGGTNGWGVTSDLIRYNTNTTRREKVSSMHFARDGLQLVELGGYLYAIGGRNLTAVEKYDPSTDRWSMVAKTHFSHDLFGATAHDGKIYACSHFGFESYDPNTDQWTVLEAPHNYWGSTLVSMNGLLWSLGGGIDDHHCQSVFTYDTEKAVWSQQPDMLVGRRFHTSFVVNH